MEPLLRCAFFESVAGSRELVTGLTRRRVTGRLSFEGKTAAVVGMRRAGKTTFTHQLRAEQAGDGTPLACLPMVSLEDERLIGLDASRLGRLVDEYADRQLAAGSGTHPMVWFLDEIQVVPGWERLVRRMLDTCSVRVTQAQRTTEPEHSSSPRNAAGPFRPRTGPPLKPTRYACRLPASV